MISPLALLGLVLDRPLHGYAMRRAIESEYAPFWKIEWAHLYRSLAGLTRQGYLRTSRARSHDGPPRKLYHLTRSGSRALRRWLHEPSTDRDELLVKAGMALAAGEDIGEAIDLRRQDLAKAREQGRVRLERARASGEASRWLLAGAALRDAEAGRAPLELAACSWPPRPERPSGSLQPEHRRQRRPAAQPSGCACRRHARNARQPGWAHRGHSAREADAAGAHLLDLESGDYNTPFLRHVAPEEQLLVVAFAMRETGVMLARGNPRDIRDLRDLGRPGVRLVNRPQGTGTRLLFFARLRQAGVDPHALKGWERTAPTHDAVAACVAAGRADAGPGIRAAAQAWGLDFMPLGIERYDLILPRRVYDSPRGLALMQALSSEAWTAQAARLPGYETSRAGQVLAAIS
jgi:molybdate-binding protein/DNA-binding PadR family transcriptional regulator